MRKKTFEFVCLFAFSHLVCHIWKSTELRIRKWMHIHAHKLLCRLDDFMVCGSNSPTEVLSQLLSRKCKNVWILAPHYKDFCLGFTTVWNMEESHHCKPGRKKKGGGCSHYTVTYWNLQTKPRRSRKSRQSQAIRAKSRHEYNETSYGQMVAERHWTS